jgi:hypothetical protein
MDGKAIYYAQCGAEDCAGVWRFVEHRGIAESIVLPYLREHLCQCGEHYDAVSVEHVEAQAHERSSF